MDNGELYEQRAVAFLDILGFKEIISDAKRIAEVHDLQKNIRDRAANMPNLGKGLQLTFFSDCIVFSAPIGDGSGANVVSTYSGFIQQLLLSREFLIRGAIAVGDLHHDGPILFGPAMIDAYKQESRGTYYPRVVVSDAVVNLAGQYAASIGGIHTQMFKNMFRTDFDGQKYVDFFGPAISTIKRFRPDYNFDPATAGPKKKTYKYKEIGKQVVPFVQKFCADAKSDTKLAATPGATAKYDWLDNYIKQCRTIHSWS